MGERERTLWRALGAGLYAATLVLLLCFAVRNFMGGRPSPAVNG
jgi:hypothetical protein